MSKEDDYRDVPVIEVRVRGGLPPRRVETDLAAFAHSWVTLCQPTHMEGLPTFMRVDSLLNKVQSNSNRTRQLADELVEQACDLVLEPGYQKRFPYAAGPEQTLRHSVMLAEELLVLADLRESGLSGDSLRAGLIGRIDGTLAESGELTIDASDLLGPATQDGHGASSDQPAPFMHTQWSTLRRPIGALSDRYVQKYDATRFDLAVVAVLGPALPEQTQGKHYETIAARLRAHAVLAEGSEFVLELPASGVGAALGKAVLGYQAANDIELGSGLAPSPDLAAEISALRSGPTDDKRFGAEP